MLVNIYSFLSVLVYVFLIAIPTVAVAKLLIFYKFRSTHSTVASLVYAKPRQMFSERHPQISVLVVQNALSYYFVFLVVAEMFLLLQTA